MRSSRLGASRYLLVAAVLFICACDAGSDTRTEKIVPGMSRDSAIALLRSPMEGAPPVAINDANANIWRVAKYLMNGKMIEVIWYSPANEHRTAADTVPEKTVIPIVLMDDKVLSSGRAGYKKVAAEYLLLDKY